MIERYTIKFGPAVSQKDLEKAFASWQEGIDPPPEVHKMKARIELIGDFRDIKKLSDLLKQLNEKQ